MQFDRRQILRAAAGASLGVLSARAARGAIFRAGGSIVVASSNGAAACERAYKLLTAGTDPVDAAVAGVNLVEDDPNDHSVGFGGLPNEEGVVELDSSVMHGPTHKAGAVAGLRNIRNPSKVAALVMRRTDHVLLVGDGALTFARAHGFVEQDLLTPESRAMWLRWKETLSERDAWIAPPEAATQPTPPPTGRGAELPQPGGAGAMKIDGEIGLESLAGSEAGRSRAGVEYTWGTITCLALNAAGDFGGCTTTSGLSYKLPGRVGDSPIIGAGLYVDNEVGACGSTGRGEANLLNLSSFQVVELMRGGLEPEAACVAVLKRVAAKVESRLRGPDGQPAFALKLYALRKDGLIGGASMRAGGGEMTAHDANGPRVIKLASAF